MSSKSKKIKLAEEDDDSSYDSARESSSSRRPRKTKTKNTTAELEAGLQLFFKMLKKVLRRSHGSLSPQQKIDLACQIWHEMSEEEQQMFINVAKRLNEKKAKKCSAEKNPGNSELSEDSDDNDDEDDEDIEIHWLDVVYYVMDMMR